MASTSQGSPHLKTIKWLLILCIFINVVLIFSNIFNPTGTIEQIDRWLESSNSPERLLSEEVIKNIAPITINGEVKAVLEVEKTKKN